jgi:hypothetical protein
MAGFPIFTPPSPAPFFNLPNQPDYSGGIAAGISGIGDSFRANRAEDFAAQKLADEKAYNEAQIAATQDRTNVARLGVGADLAKLGLTFDTTGGSGTSTPGSGVSPTGGPDWGGSGFKPIPGYKAPPDAATVTATGELSRAYETSPGVTRYRATSPSVKYLAANVDNNAAVSDIAYIYGIAKIFDPTSTVSNGEVHMTEGLASIKEVLQGYLNQKIAGGAALSPEARRQMVTLAQSVVDQYRTQAEADYNFARKQVKALGLDPDTVLKPLDTPFDMATIPPPTPAGGTPPQPPTPR